LTDLLEIGGVRVAPGERASIALPVARLHTSTELTMPVRVVRGKTEGPVLFVSAAIHGDEINGVEIIRRLLRLKSLSKLRGSLIAVPVVNVFGFLAHTRYLPDRRDLNRTFPGGLRGTLGARLAELFMREIVFKSTHGIDLHTGSKRRTNLPHVRVSFSDRESKRLAIAFGAPVVLNAGCRKGSLREAVTHAGMPFIVYEGGEDLRFDEWAIRSGLKGIKEVMHTLGMLPGNATKKRPFLAKSSRWVRAPAGGIFRSATSIGTRVRRGQLVGTIGDPFGENQFEVFAPTSGIVVGANTLPLVNEGDQLYHVARVKAPGPDDEDPVAELLAELMPS
jgi:uncharacterized protein